MGERKAKNDKGIIPGINKCYEAPMSIENEF